MFAISSISLSNSMKKTGTTFAFSFLVILTDTKYQVYIAVLIFKMQ